MRGRQFAKENPGLYGFDEDELSQEPEEDEEGEHAFRGRSALRMVGHRIGELALSTKKSESATWDSIRALQEALEELETELRETFAETARAVGQRFDEQAQAAKSNATLLFWALLIGFGLVLYLKH
ncbi:MAG: hypothetical protein GY937_00260 [bacterium]|nr:hypothetical protein [bacterium]